MGEGRERKEEGREGKERRGKGEGGGRERKEGGRERKERRGKREGGGGEERRGKGKEGKERGERDNSKPLEYLYERWYEYASPGSTSCTCTRGRMSMVVHCIIARIPPATTDGSALDFNCLRP